jgi:hypothetical protein
MWMKEIRKKSLFNTYLSCQCSFPGRCGAGLKLKPRQQPLMWRQQPLIRQQLLKRGYVGENIPESGIIP